MVPLSISATASTGEEPAIFTGITKLATSIAMAKIPRILEYFVVIIPPNFLTLETLWFRGPSAASTFRLRLFKTLESQETGIYLESQ
jgi:hypothetical protein